MSSVNQAFAKINVEQKDINLTTGSHTEETTLVRARDEKGHYVKDDLSTPDVNEAWVEKPKVKPKAKKKVAKKV